VVLLAMGCLAPAVRAAVPSASASPYPGGRYTPPAASYGTSEDTNVSIVVDDGTKIVADVVYPTDLATGKRITNKTFPVLLTQTPYEGGGVGALEGGGTSAPGAYFVQRGYIFVDMDIRGTGRSEGRGGEAELFNPREGLDGLTVAYWASDPANVKGSNGLVGLEGCSALGISQIATLMALGRIEREGGGTVTYNGTTKTVNAKTSPIRASIPQCLSGNMFGDTFFDNGIPSPINLLATAPIGLALSGVNTKEPSTNVTGSMNNVDMFNGGSWGYYRDFWKTNDRVAFANDVARTKVPLLGWVGWGEGGFIGAQQLYGVLQNAAAGKKNPWAPMAPGQKPSPMYQMIIGDWGHAGGLDQGIELEWYDTWIKGADTGLKKATQPIHMQELRPKAATDSSTASERWVNARTYPESSSYATYHLAAGNTLASSSAVTSAPDRLVWAPGQSVTYRLHQPFGQDMTVLGPSGVRVYASSSSTNMAMFAELEDVDPATGTATPITHGSILESRRELLPQKSWTLSNGKLGTRTAQGAAAQPIAPYLTLDHDDYATPPGTVIALDIPLQPVTWRLARGHLLELDLMAQAPQSECSTTVKIGAAPTGCDYTKPMLETISGTYTIVHDAAHPSTVAVALVPSASLPDAQARVTPTSSDVPLPSCWANCPTSH
jgi:predicted acyl esterase